MFSVYAIKKNLCPNKLLYIFISGLMFLPEEPYLQKINICSLAGQEDQLCHWPPELQEYRNYLSVAGCLVCPWHELILSSI